MKSHKTKSRLKRKSKSKGRKKAEEKKRIVRILGSGQYAVSSGTLKRLNTMDNSIVSLLKKDSKDAQKRFRKNLEKMVSMVRNQGKRLNPKHIIASNVIIPDKDVTLDEAKKMFSGEGIVPEELVF
jgi:hypothetical protein